MQTLRTYRPFFAAALLLCVLLYIVYPYYHFYVDPDAAAYLTIAKRYAVDDTARAINGYWSPWSCWLVSHFMAHGHEDLFSMVLVNSMGAIGFLYISQSFFVKFGVHEKLQWWLGMALACFLCYAIFWQSFDDLWECFFLLAALRVMLNERFSSNAALWTLTGILSALAYFAKAYAFPFFILNTVCCSYLLARDKWLKISAVCILVMVFCSSGWIYALHEKYGIWTTSTAGPLNMSWYLVGHPYWKDGIQHLLPPVYPGSPSYWEDPWFVNGKTPQFWSSFALFGRQFLKGGYNFLKFLLSIVQLSVFFPLIIWLAIRLLCSSALKAKYPTKLNAVALSFLLFPLAYMFINFEPRYIWYMLPLALVLAALWIQRQFAAKPQMFRLGTLFLSLSLLIIPVHGMDMIYLRGKDEYELANMLKMGGLSGTFTSNAKPGLESQQALRIAYFSGLSYYNVLPGTKLPDIIAEMKRYSVKYYFYFKTDPEDKFLLTDRYGFPYREVYVGAQYKIFEMVQ